MEPKLVDSSELLGAATSKVKLLEVFLNALCHDLKFEGFVEECLNAVVEATKVEAGSVLEIDRDHQHIFFRAVYGRHSQPLADSIIPLGKGIVGHVIESGQPAVINDVPENKMHLNSIAKSVNVEVRNLVALPLVIRGKIFGVLEVMNRRGEPEFTTQDVDLLMYAAKMFAKTIEIRLMLSWVKKAQASGNTSNAA